MIEVRLLVAALWTSVCVTVLSVRADDSQTSLAVQEPVYSEVDREHWSFLPITTADPPRFEHGWIRTPIDAFILKTLRENDLEPAPRADRRTLIRRVTFDLTGLPPTPDEIAGFLSEADFDRAWDAVLDRLLDSEQYGVRQAQHWLDVIRFAESEGFEYDRHLPGAWMFRDYVVHAFNSDKPYDEFVREQIAGDELAGPTEVLEVADRSFHNPEFEQRVAAGFHRFGPVRRNAGNAVVAFSRNEVLTERTNIIGTAFMGVSLGCARCHDHMFDPIGQFDYYRMQAFLASTYARDVPFTDQQTWRTWKTTTDAVNEEIERVRDALSQAADDEELRLKEELNELRAQLPEPLPTLFTVEEDLSQRSDIHVLRRGDEFEPGVQVGMRPLGVLLPDGSTEFPPDTELPKLKLADWIVDSQNPLTPRVMVNRIWQQHFGMGLVRTANDFGLNGAWPSHPELLDWLATEFIRGAWRPKSIHRLILNSNAYLQSHESTARRRAEKLDPNNELVWHHSRRRLSAEEVRDAMLCVSGRLNPQMGGPSVIVPVDPEMVGLLYDPDQWEVTDDSSQHDRRSIYLMAKRNLRLPFLEVFDQPDLLTSCARREQSTHAPQALELLNGPLANDLAKSLGERLRSECAGDVSKSIERAFELATGRRPSPRQQELATEFLKDHPLSEFALAMFNLNAFLYVD